MHLPTRPPLVVTALLLAVGMSACEINHRESPAAQLGIVDSSVPPVDDDAPSTSVASLSPAVGATAAVWTVIEVIDGDTLRVTADGAEETVRLIGIDAPEQDECFADESTNGLRFFTAGSPTVRLVGDTTPVDDFGRLLRYVETPDGLDLGEAMVRAGFAVPQPIEPDTARADAYDLARRDAQTAGVGQWEPGVCGAPAPTRSGTSPSTSPTGTSSGP